MGMNFFMFLMCRECAVYNFYFKESEAIKILIVIKSFENFHEMFYNSTHLNHNLAIYTQFVLNNVILVVVHNTMKWKIFLRESSLALSMLFKESEK